MTQSEVVQKFSMDIGVPVEVTYTNWEGKTRKRHIVPLRLWYGCTK